MAKIMLTNQMTDLTYLIEFEDNGQDIDNLIERLKQGEEIDGVVIKRKEDIDYEKELKECIRIEEDRF